MESLTKYDRGSLADLEAVIKAHDRFLVSSHTHTDGDAVGASLAFKRMLEQLGKDVIWVMDEDPGEMFERFYDPRELVIGTEQDTFPDREVVVIVDANEWRRIGKISEVLKNHPAKKMCIDHHYPKGEFPGTLLARVKSPSTTVIMYNLFKHLGLEWTHAIAEPIYLGIIVDTLNFHLPHTNAETHYIAAECLSVGVDPTHVYEPVYGTTSPGKLQLMCEAFQTIQILFDGKVSMMHTTRDMFERAGAQRNDDDGFVEFLRTLKGAAVAIYMRQETNGKVKVSWRAKGQNNIVKSAQKFGGGGHMRAAGASIEGPVEEIKQKVLEDMQARVNAGEIQ